jgi:hypothetical protein
MYIVQHISFSKILDIDKARNRYYYAKTRHFCLLFNKPVKMMTLPNEKMIKMIKKLIAALINKSNYISITFNIYLPYWILGLHQKPKHRHILP